MQNASYCILPQCACQEDALLNEYLQKNRLLFFSKKNNSNFLNCFAILTLYVKLRYLLFGSVKVVGPGHLLK